jgi:two-component system response regulator RegX3
MGKHVLCVDDDRDTCEMITVLLGQAGYEVTYALTVADGLKFAHKGHLDLIILDWHYQDGTGLELCKQIRTFDTETPILFYSGIVSESDIKEALIAGAQGYIVKPTGIEEVLQTISRHISSEGRASQKAH